MRTFNIITMDNPRPKSVFFADIGRRDNSEYCEVDSWYVVEAESYDSVNVSAIRVWKPVISPPKADFNPHIVSDWEIERERWYNNQLDLMTEFEKVCECEDNLLQFVCSDC